MKVVADAGPLMALAKIDALELLHQLFPLILVAPAVHQELIPAGLRLGAPDAVVLQEAFAAEWISVRKPSRRFSASLGAGEEESICLALDVAADWLLIDDYGARKVAEGWLRSHDASTQIKGTLGVIVSAFEARLVGLEDAVSFLEALKRRSDIWIREELCQSVIEALKRASV